jgi:type I restriction enzyme S subunit
MISAATPIVRLGELTTLISSGSTPKGGSEIYLSEGPVMLIRSQNVRMNELVLHDVAYITEDIHSGMNRSKAQFGDVLLNITGASIGRVACFEMSGVKANVNQHVCIIRSKPDGFIPRYLTHLISSPAFQSEIDRLQHGGTRQALTFSQISEFKIPLPPLAEQRRIAEVLDRAEALRAKRRAARAQLDELTQAIFLDMFGDPARNGMRWRSCAVGDVTNCIVPGRDKPKSFSGNTPWITTDDLHHLERTFSSPKGYGLNTAEISQVRARVIPHGSVIISCVGDLGIVSLAGADMVINQQLHSFQCHECVENVFLMYCLHYQKAFMYAKASSTTLPYMNKAICNSIPVILPPIELQREFARRVTAVETLKTAHRASLAELDALFASLQHRAFRGEL